MPYKEPFLNMLLMYTSLPQCNAQRSCSQLENITGNLFVDGGETAGTPQKTMV